ncbi:ADP-ribose glycohydrolase MACROD2-like isoform X2 [Babylonia areolata]|uniref:ADP-ribose glycohydrolase MACROD2-like isoform X2 n=1 Tax=Babylonia areolata TaxID=304850 RepID=UPI003FD0A41D
MKRGGRLSFDKAPGFGGNKSHGTRAAIVQEEIRAEKEKYSSMPIEKKRKSYKCGDDGFLTLNNIPTWLEYVSEYRKSQALERKSSKSSSVDKARSSRRTARFPVNEKLNKKISLFRGDITTLEIDAIVNAANNSLLGGGGVDGAIHAAAGSFLKRECSTLSGCDTGDAKITCGYKLPAKHVIHTVGPIGEKPDMLHSAYRRSLEVLQQNQLASVAFPCISTGIYGYPAEAAAHVALDTIRHWMENEVYSKKVERIILCVFLKKDLEVYEDLLHIYFPLSDDGGKGKKADAEEVSASHSPSKKSAEERKDTAHTDTTTTTTTTRLAQGREEVMDTDDKGDNNAPTAATTTTTARSTETGETEAQESDAKGQKQEKEDAEKGKGSKRKSKGEGKDLKGEEEEEEDAKEGKQKPKL